MGAFDVNIDNMWKVGKMLTMLLISKSNYNIFLFDQYLSREYDWYWLTEVPCSCISNYMTVKVFALYH